ncbi:MAG TPA: hypothetical protein VNB06_12780 [Thermoanaerobaculia bacterium]|nr:hypothetical protein [Thermoanaerobaculia bacterium]
MTAGGSSRRSISRPAPAANTGDRAVTMVAWSVLVALLLALLLGAATFDPRRWPSPVGDESTYLMAAQSLAWDGDLRYDLADLDRFRALRGTDPDGLILQSADGGNTLLYAKPVWYPLYLAPFVRVLGLRGPAIANVLLLAAAAMACATALRPVAGAASPLWAAAFLFASVAFAQVFWTHADLFQMALVAAGIALAVGGGVVAGAGGRVGGSVGGSGTYRFAVAGLLLGGAVALRPVYALLAVAVAVALGCWRRGLALVGGLVALAAVTVTIDHGTRGSWTSYGAERQGFYGYTKFPGEPGAESWEEGLAGRGSASWVDGDLMPSKLELRVQARNLEYLLLGRHVGLLPYFLPIVLGLAAVRRTRLAALLLLGVAATTLVLSLLRPYNFWGGGGSLANRYFLPIYPAFWFLACVPAALAARVGRASQAGRHRQHGMQALPPPLPGVLAWTLPLVVAVLAAPTLWPLWHAPRQFLRDADGGYGYVSEVARRLLPYETSQKHLKPSGREDFVLDVGNGGALWVKPLSQRVRPLGHGEEGVPAVAMEILAGDVPAEVLLGSPQPLASIEIEVVLLDAAAGVEEPRRWSTTLAPRLTAVHSMWWTVEPFYLYQLDLDQIATRAGVERTIATWTVRVSL